MNFNNNGKVFEIAIQLGAILAIVVEYRQRFANIITGIGRNDQANRFVLNLAIAFIPAAVVGLLFRKHIKEYLFNSITVAIALIVGGLLILWIEKRTQHRSPKVKKCR